MTSGTRVASGRPAAPRGPGRPGRSSTPRPRSTSRTPAAGGRVSDAAAAAAARLRRTTLTTRAAILALVVAVLTVTLAIPVRGWFAQRADIARLQDDVAAARVRVADLQDQQRRWQDPAYIEAQARERLQYVMPGEIGYVVLGGDLATQAPATRVETLDDSAWYARLWSAVRAADATPRPSGAPVVAGPAGGPAPDAPIGPSPSTSPSTARR